MSSQEKAQEFGQRIAMLLGSPTYKYLYLILTEGTGSAEMGLGWLKRDLIDEFNAFNALERFEVIGGMRRHVNELMAQDVEIFRNAAEDAKVAEPIYEMTCRKCGMYVRSTKELGVCLQCKDAGTITREIFTPLSKRGGKLMEDGSLYWEGSKNSCSDGTINPNAGGE